MRGNPESHKNKELVIQKFLDTIQAKFGCPQKKEKKPNPLGRLLEQATGRAKNRAALKKSEPDLGPN